jgi:indolepyruvate ferredoxin oxidoreductase
MCSIWDCTPPKRIYINERVCEGCGDCGRKSNCLSVQPVMTDYGRKTQIDQSSCNKDYACLEGDCPAFISVVPSSTPVPAVGTLLTTEHFPEPECHFSGDQYTIRILGIGGTGVVTLSQLLATAAATAGFEVRALDQTGLSQKGGAVISDVELTREQRPLANKAAKGEADLLLGCDLLVAAAPNNLAQADPDRTVVVVSVAWLPPEPWSRIRQWDFPTESNWWSASNLRQCDPTPSLLMLAA